jgi:hypothetical protein
MDNIFAPGNLPDKNEIRKQKEIAVLRDKIEDEDITHQELKSAYELSLGLSQEEILSSKDIEEKIKKLALDLQKMTTEGLALTSVVEVLEETNRENMVLDLYGNFIEQLKISKKEKDILMSIIEKKKAGLLVISDRQSLDKLAEAKIPEFSSAKDYPFYQIVAEIINFLNKFKNKDKIEISFIQ